MQAAILFCSLNKSLHWHSGADWYIALQNISRQLWLLLTKARSSSTACITCLGNLAALKLKLYSSNCAFSFYVIYLAISTPPQEQVMQWRMTIPRKKHLYQAEPGSEMTSWSNPQKSPHSLSPIHQLGEFKPGRGLGASGHVQHQRYENVGRSKTRPPWEQRRTTATSNRKTALLKTFTFSYAICLLYYVRNCLLHVLGFILWFMCHVINPVSFWIWRQLLLTLIERDQTRKPTCCRWPVFFASEESSCTNATSLPEDCRGKSPKITVSD